MSTRKRAPRVHPPLPSDLHHSLQHGRERLGAEKVREADQRLGVGHALAIDGTEGPIDEAGPDLALTFVEAPVMEMLEQKHAEDDRGGRSEAPASAAQRVAAESGGDEVDEVFIVQELVDRPELGGPELVTIGQQYLEDAALRIRATDHGAPSRRVGYGVLAMRMSTRTSPTTMRPNERKRQGN